MPKEEEGVQPPPTVPPATQIIDRQIDKALDARGLSGEALSGFGGGSAGGGGEVGRLEARVAKVEASAEHIEKDISDLKGEMKTLRENARTDFRLLFGAIITATLGLAGLIGKGFHWF